MTFVEISVANFGTFRCGGSLISSTHVLTAAHCVVEDAAAPTPQKLPVDAFGVFLGEVDASRFLPGDARAVVDVEIHPNWDPDSTGTGPYDVAVLKLAQPVPQNLGTVIPFIDSGDTRFEAPGQPLVVAGWGAIFEDGPVSDRLLEVGVNVVGDQQCASDYVQQQNFDSAVMLCAALPGRDSCGGDSGGPLFVDELVGHRVERRKKGRKCKKKRNGKKRCKPKYKKVKIPIFQQTQVGAVSFGFGCAQPNFPGVYVRLSDPVVNAFIVSELAG